jgi:ABC-type phosphate transport system permease subunit
MVIVLPLGVGAAVYLTEYAANRRVAAVIEFAAETLTGIPVHHLRPGGHAVFPAAHGD